MRKNSALMDLLENIPDLEFRTIEGRDMIFLKKVYRSIREKELEWTQWNEQQKSDFITQQFEAQHAYYTENYQGACFEIILINNKPAGRLYLVEWTSEFRIIDITLLPEFRGQGWGGRILKSIIKKASCEKKAVGIHVEKNNPAMSLYQRLGFTNKEDKGVYQFLTWSPDEIKNNK